MADADEVADSCMMFYQYKNRVMYSNMGIKPFFNEYFIQEHPVK